VINTKTFRNLFKLKYNVQCKVDNILAVNVLIKKERRFMLMVIVYVVLAM